MVSNLKKAMLFMVAVSTLSPSTSTHASQRLQQFQNASLATKAAVCLGAGILGYGAASFKKYYDTPDFGRRHPMLKANIKNVASALQTSGMVWAIMRAIEYLFEDRPPADGYRLSTNLFGATLTGGIVNAVLANALSDKETTKVAVAEVPKETLKDFVGDIPQEIDVLVDYLKPTHTEVREQWAQNNVQPYKGVLLEGTPGNGKTQLVRSIAGEVGVPLLATKRSDYVSMWHGQTEQNIKTVFETARKAADASPTGTCILFIDEMDAMVPNRDNAGFGTSSTTNGIVAEFLAQMDGFEQFSPSNSATTSWWSRLFGAKKQASKPGHVIVIGATNRAHDIDPAVKRAGRLDCIITIEAPSEETRVKLLTHYLRKFTQGCAAPSVWEEDQKLMGDIRAIASKCKPNTNAATLREHCQNAVRVFIKKQISARKTKDSLKIKLLEPELLAFLEQEVHKHAKEEPSRLSSSSSSAPRSLPSLHPSSSLAGVGSLVNMGDHHRPLVEEGARVHNAIDNLNYCF